jgi:TorA maturation chaperone TorD
MPTPGERLRLLAGLLAAPGPEGLPILNELAREHTWLEPACRELEGLGPEDWIAEHGRLFINGFPKTPCLPFESAQLNGVMHGPATGQMAMLYARYGLAAKDDLPADYLGTMLEFGALLADEACHADVSLELWQGHLLRWLPGYGQTLMEESRLILYRLLGAGLAEVCEEMAIG